MIDINHTTVIIIITVIISMMAWQNTKILDRLIFLPAAVKRGEYDRFLTHGFIHADGMHLLFNMFTLYFFGRVVEHFYIHKFGNLGFVAFYALAIIAAIIPSYLKNKNNPRYLSLGASGAVSAVLFAYVLFNPWDVIWLFAVIPMPAIVFAVAYTAYSIYAERCGTGNINHSAHLFGALFGVVATLIIEPTMILHFLTRLLNPAFF